MEFGEARNAIIHEGKVSQLEYSLSNTAYNGHFFGTAEFLLRGVIKVLLSKIYEDDQLPSGSILRPRGQASAECVVRRSISLRSQPWRS